MDFKWVVPDANFYSRKSKLKVNLSCSEPLDKAFYNYAIKYKTSASLLVDYLINGNDIRALDSYFFPLAFLYRHSIELVLKSICFKHIKDSKKGIEFLRKTFHNLGELFEMVKQLEVSILSDDADGIEWITNYFKSINEIDKESDSFRYPFSINFDREYSIKPIFNKQTHINLVAFANKMEVAYELLCDIYNSTFGSITDYIDLEPIFLEEGGHYHDQSVLGYKYSAYKFYLFTTAYTESADFLFKQIEKEEENVESLFLPMCYLFRNALELSLKETLVEECSYTFQEAIAHVHDKKHKVMGLWNLIKDEICEHANAPEGDSTTKDAGLYIKQINDFDGESDKFRYPVNKYLTYHFKNPKYLDVKHINLFFGEILSFLSGVNAMMSSHNEIKAEIEAEYRSEMMTDYYE